MICSSVESLHEAAPWQYLNPFLWSFALLLKGVEHIDAFLELGDVNNPVLPPQREP